MLLWVRSAVLRFPTTWRRRQHQSALAAAAKRHPQRQAVERAEYDLALSAERSSGSFAVESCLISPYGVGWEVYCGYASAERRHNLLQVGVNMLGASLAGASGAGDEEGRRVRREARKRS
jgi:hypothetical protein